MLSRRCPALLERPQAVDRWAETLHVHGVAIVEPLPADPVPVERVPVLIGPILIAFIARVPVRSSSTAPMAAVPATAAMAPMAAMAKKMHTDECDSDKDPHPVLRKPSHFSFPLRD